MGVFSIITSNLEVGAFQAIIYMPPEFLSRLVTFDFKPYTRGEFLEVAQQVITGQLGKDSYQTRYVAERVVLRTKDVRQAIQVAKLCDSVEEVVRFGVGFS